MMMMSTSLVKSHMLECQSHMLNKQQNISTLCRQMIAAVRAQVTSRTEQLFSNN